MKRYLNNSAKIVLGSFATFYGLAILTIATAGDTEKKEAKTNQLTVRSSHAIVSTAQYFGGGLAGGGLVSIGLGTLGLYTLKKRQKRIMQAFSPALNRIEKTNERC